MTRFAITPRADAISLGESYRAAGLTLSAAMDFAKAAGIKGITLNRVRRGWHHQDARS